MRILSLFILISGLSFQVFAQKLTLEESILGARKFAPQTREQINWVKGSDTYYYVKDNTLIMGKVKGKGVETNMFTLDELNTWKGGEAMKAMPAINWSSLSSFWVQDGNKYYVVDLKTHEVKLFAEHPEDAENVDFHDATGSIAFTKANNLYAIKGGKTIQVTSNANDIVSGQSISRNEYGITKGTFWSPNGAKLAFYQKDESNVSNYPLTNFVDVPATIKEIKYPFAGQKSEIVSVGVYDATNGKTVFLSLTSGKADDQFYATNLGWSPDGTTVYIAWMNRATTDMELRSYDATTGTQKAVLIKEHSDKWVEPEQPVQFVPGKNDQFLWFSQRNGHNNLYLYKTDGTLVSGTNVNWEIKEIVGYDAKGEYAFVMGTGENPTDMMCFKVQLSTMAVTPVSTERGVHHVSISYTGEFVIDQFTNLKTPNKIDIISGSGRLVKNLILSTDPFAGRQLGQIELFSIKAKDGRDLWCRIIKPSDFDPKKRYPVVVYVYGGPHAQMNTNSFSGGASLWMRALAEEGYIIFTLDNHGSGNRGQAFEHIIHRRLGAQEVADQMLGVDWLKKQSFVDSDRMAVHGWSFGGFMTTSLMLKQPGTFKVGVAGGPVIDWSLYEVMYGERYMDTPAENPEGYKENDLTQYVKNLQGKLLMIHGTVDDVVVMQHNMKFVKACVDNRVQVDFFAYPGHPHNVGGKDRLHLMTKVIDYIKAELE